MEIEELSTQVLVPRSHSRVSLTGAIVVAGLAILLAGGFGLLGGRSGAPTPTRVQGSQVAEAPTPGIAETEPPIAPRVTPWAPCSEPPGPPPEPVLIVDGRQHAGQLLVSDRDGTSGPAGTTGPDGPLETIEVPMDSVTDIRITGARCAVGWYISMMPAEGERLPIVLDSVANDGLDPSIASQNRFEIFVAPHAGDHELRALFDFPDFGVRATWAIHVPELERPQVRLLSGDREIQTVIGCDVTQRLVNQLEEPLNPCGLDVVREPSRPANLAPGEILAFEIDGWVPTGTSAYCGQMEDRRFIPRADPPCLRERDPQFAGMRFHAPDETGVWTIAISTCATRLQATGQTFEELCGTWYANVRVRS